MSLDWHEARDRFRRTGRALLAPEESVPLSQAVGRTLAAPVAARAAVPGFDASAMDGWVVCGDGPWLVGAEISIGDAPGRAPLHPGTARRIATGAPVPPGPVAILRRECGVDQDGRLHLRAGTPEPAVGADVRRTGEELTAGEALLAAGSRLSPASVALAAVAGLDELTVRVPPTVQPFVLGSEIVSAGVPVPGRVRDAYTPTLPALLAALGARVERPRLLPDDQEEVEAALAYSGAELLITTGSSSHGPTDRLRAALEATGCELVVDGVAMRPGHPVLLARRRDGRPVLGLPGNPFAGLVALLTLGVPLLDGMLGRPVPRPRTASAAEDIPNPRPGVRIVAARTGDGGVVAVDFQGPAMLRGLAAADVLAVIPEGGVRRSDEVLTVLLPW